MHGAGRAAPGRGPGHGAGAREHRHQRAHPAPLGRARACTIGIGTLAKRVLKPTGTYVIIGHEHYGAASGRILGNLPHFFKLVALAPFDRHLPALSFSMPGKTEIMTELKQLLEAEKLKPVIARNFPLCEARAAMRYMQDGGGLGKIIITP